MSRRNPERRRRASRIEVPETGVGPHVKLAFSEMKRQGVTYDEIEAGAGVLRATVKSWKRKNRPSLAAIEAVLGYLGWDFVPVPRSKALPPEVVARLQPVATSLGMDMERTIQALVEIVSDIHVDLKAARTPRPKREPEPPKRRRGDPHPDQVSLFEGATIH
jgi:transcriptional regulator with XRE-family HTH domain